MHAHTYHGRHRHAKSLLLPALLPVLLQYAADELPPDQATLWFAGKQMLPDKKLSEYVGRHEKTKAVVKLQKKGQGAPAREPVGADVVCSECCSMLCG